MINKEDLRQRYVMLGVFPVNVDIPMSVLGKLWELKDDEDEVALIVDELERESLLARSGTGVVLHSLQHAYVRMRWETPALNAGPNEAHCKALDAMYEVYNERGYYMITLPCILESMKLKEALGIQLDAMSVYKLAMAYKNQGEYAKALEMYEKSLGIKLKSLGPDHPDTAATYYEIGSVYNHQGEYAKALDMYEKSLGIKLKSLGPDHPSTAATYHEIGTVYTNQGKYAKALATLERYEKSLEIDLQSLGPDHPGTAATYHSIGTVYANQGEYAKALERYEKSLEIKLHSLGPDHPDTAARQCLHKPRRVCQGIGKV